MTSVLRRMLPGRDIDRGQVARFTVGHVGADLFQGAVPALIPFFVGQRGFSYADAGLLVLAGSLASSVTQPVAGFVGDRLRARWLPQLGLAVAGAGLFAATLLHSFTAIAISLLVGGLGVAIFHPEAIRATRAAAATSPGAALGVFAVGGNVGFALGPALVVPLGAGVGIEAAAAVALIPLTAAVLLGRGATSPAQRPLADRAPPPVVRSDWQTFWYATAAATSVTAVLFGLMAFVPVWFASDLASSVHLGSVAISAMLIAGAVGTYLGGRLSDRYQRKVIILAALAALVPLAGGLPLASPAVAVPLLVLIGLAIEASLYPLVIVAQDALPRRVGLASGIVLGLSVGAAAGTTSLLGRLVDTSGPRAALWVCSAIAGAAFVFGALTKSPHRPRPCVGSGWRAGSLSTGPARSRYSGHWPVGVTAKTRGGRCH